MLIAWTGQWRTTKEGHRLKCTIGIPLLRGIDLAEMLKAKGVYRPELDVGINEPAAPPEFDPAIIARREPDLVEELAKQGEDMALAIQSLDQGEKAAIERANDDTLQGSTDLA